MEERLAAAAAEGELQAARAIQLSMVPPRSSLAAIDPRIDVDALLEPARTVGGDFFDLEQIDPRPHRLRDRRRHRQGCPGGAVHGHVQGADASAMSRDAPDLDRAAAAINRELIRDNQRR